jgi:small ligand-binding sensory domain FIST
MPIARFQFASAISDAADTAEAIDVAVERVRATLRGPVDLALVFVTPHHRNTLEMVRELLALTLRPRVTMAVTAGGVIGVRKELEGVAGLSLLSASLPGASLQAFSSDDLDPRLRDGPDAVRSYFADAHGGELPGGVLLFVDPFSTPISSLLPQLSAGLEGVPVIGGVASGATQPGGNRLMIDGTIHTRGLIGLALGGAARLDCTVSQGCRPIGRPLVITKAKRNVIMELGGRPALDVAQEMIATSADGDRDLVQSSGLFIGRVINEYKERFGRGDFLIRGVLGVDPNGGYIAVGDTAVRIGQTIQFHIRDERTAREDFSLLLEAQKLHSDGGGPGGALLFSCNGRGTHLFSSPNADADMIHEALGEIPLAGFFAAGEIGPVGSESFLHGHTASLAVIRGM